MKRVTLFFLFAASTILLFSGCDGFSEIGSEGPEHRAGINQAGATLTSADIPVNNYLVHFDGRTYHAGADQTTFDYTVSGTGAGATLTRFGIELPDCAPELDHFSPLEGVNIDNSARIEWNLDIAPTGSRSYSITFPGNVPQGTVRVGVKSGLVDGVALAPGPCGGATLFDISGTVFSDANLDGALESEETGIADVTVHLLSGLGLVATTVTDGHGAYVFADQIAGDYTVLVPDVTAATDFNEDLFDDFSYTGASAAVSIDVSIGPASTGNDFGFTPNVEEIIEEVIAGDIESNGETVRFWKAQLKGALGEEGRNNEAEIDAATMQGYLDAIEAFLLVSPYQFDDGNEFQAAFDILRTDSREDIDQLLKELLAAELNHVSGRGIENVNGLQEVLLGWGEALVLDNAPGLSAQKAPAAPAQTLNSLVTLQEATALFRVLNGGGGSGGGNE